MGESMPPAIDSARQHLWLRMIETDPTAGTHRAFLRARGDLPLALLSLPHDVGRELHAKLSTKCGKVSAVCLCMTLLLCAVALVLGEGIAGQVAGTLASVMSLVAGLSIVGNINAPSSRFGVEQTNVPDESLGRRTGETIPDFPLPLRFAAAFDQVFRPLRWSDSWKALPPDGRPDLVALRYDFFRRACRLEEKMLARRVDNEGRDLFRVDYGTVAELFPDDVNDLLAKLEYIDQYRNALHDGAHASGALTDDHPWLALRSSTADLEAQSAILDSLNNLAQPTAQPQPLNAPKPDSDPA